MVNSGDKVKINGTEYTLGSKIGGGLEGTVFNVVDCPKYVIKIINDRNLSVHKRKEIYEHLRWLKDLGARNKTIPQCMTVPKALLDDHLGYIMRKAGEHESLKKYISPPDDGFDGWYAQEYPLKKRYQILVNLFYCLREIHMSGLIFTDLSPNNIMVHKKENQIVFIDADNTRRRTDKYNGVLGTPGYMAPEVYRNVEKISHKYGIDKELFSECGVLSSETDIFSAAVIAFQLLTLQHPFIGDIIENGTPEDEEEALKIKTDFIFKDGTSNNSTYGLTSVYNEITTVKIRELFYRTFVDGRDNPALRPSGDEFIEAFKNALDIIVTCNGCNYSRIYEFDQENRCINCGEFFDKKLVLTIFNRFRGVNRSEAINNIGNYTQYDVSEENLIDSYGNPPSDCLEISKIVLEPQEPKYLYLWHFEKTVNRSKKYALVTNLETTGEIEFKVLKNTLDEAVLIGRDGTRDKIFTSKKFSSENYGILFEKKNYSNGYFLIYCKFSKE